jgi:hypothetical protein
MEKFIPGCTLVLQRGEGASYTPRAAKFKWLKTWTLLGPLVHSFRIVLDHFQKNFFRNKLISATSPPPPHQKIFGQCTILGVKKNFPEQLLANIAPFLREYCTTTFIWTTNCGLSRFFAFLFPLYKHVRIFFRTNRQYFR